MPRSERISFKIGVLKPEESIIREIHLVQAVQDRYFSQNTGIKPLDRQTISMRAATRPIRITVCHGMPSDFKKPMMAMHMSWSSTVDLREFLFQELEEPLAAGRQYRLDFRVSLADSFNFAISSMGALLSIENTRDEQWQPEDFFASSPQVLNPWENLLDDKEGWTLISDTFIAQGGEKYLSIGCFRRDAEDNIQRVSSHPHGIYYWEESGYRVDGVELYEDRGIGIEEADASNLSIYPNPANDIITIATTDKHAKALEVVDLAGRMVVSTVMASVKEVVSIGHLPSGVYVVAITFGDGSIARQRCALAMAQVSELVSLFLVGNWKNGR